MFPLSVLCSGRVPNTWCVRSTAVPTGDAHVQSLFCVSQNESRHPTGAAFHTPRHPTGTTFRTSLRIDSSNAFTRLGLYLSCATSMCHDRHHFCRSVGGYELPPSLLGFCVLSRQSSRERKLLVLSFCAAHSCRILFRTVDDTGSR